MADTNTSMRTGAPGQPVQSVLDAFYAYSWHIDAAEHETTSIRVYGLDEANRTTCVQVTGFTPYAYIELPPHVEWTDGKVQLVLNKIDQLARDTRPVVRSYVRKKKLYGAHLDANGRYKHFPYIFCAFSSATDIRPLSYRLSRPLTIPGIGSVQLKMHELGASPILQLACCRKIPTAGWIRFKGRPRHRHPADGGDSGDGGGGGERVTLCDKEYSVYWKDLHPHEHPSGVVPKPLVMAFDIEVNSTNPAAMPNAGIPGDKVFQVSCVFAREGDPKDEHTDVLLSLGDPSQATVGAHVEIMRFKTEARLLEGFAELVRARGPNIISGYNILGFDLEYMIKRAQFQLCMSEFDTHGFHLYKHAEPREISWSSSAFRDQKFTFLDIEGRIYVDLLPLVRKDFKLSNYRLNTVAETFLGSYKDPLSVKGIFRCYREGVKRTRVAPGDTDGPGARAEYVYPRKARRAMGIVGKYCVQDSVLVVHLMDKLKIWPGLTELACICNVPIFTLYTQGQQNKVYAQLYKYCTYNNIVVETDAYQTKENERYMGAHVFHPVAGRYSMIVPFDFASLYPTTIIASNIDYHTWVQDDSPIPDSMCNVMQWEDHMWCEHDPKVIRIGVLTRYIDAEKERIAKLRARRDAPLTARHGGGGGDTAVPCVSDLSGLLDITAVEQAVSVVERKRVREETRVQVQQAVEALKPYIAERQEIRKGKPKETICAKRRYRFLKTQRGVVPSIIQDLLDARRRVRTRDMVSVRDRMAALESLGGDGAEGEPVPGEGHGDRATRLRNLAGMLDILDKRQLALKVSANSMYGTMGVRKGKLPFMPGAMCTTYMGRKNIEKVAEIIPARFGGELIYGDTDSNYIHFPHLKTARETWDYAEHVAREVSKLFPAPIKLEFEYEIYAFFFILTKKRYMYRKCLRDGVVDTKIGKKGVLLARRDNSKFVRDVYEAVVNAIADDHACVDVLNMVLEHVHLMCAGCKPLSDYVITKAVGSIGDLDPEVVVKPDGSRAAQLGSYAAPLLSSDAGERERQLAGKSAATAEEYYRKCLPAHVQLAERMRSRGHRVDAGSRVEFVVAYPEKPNAGKNEKFEDVAYVKEHPDLVKIDHMYYLQSLATPLDQMLDVAFAGDPAYTPQFTHAQYTYRHKVRAAVQTDIRALGTSRIAFTTRPSHPT